MSKTDHHQPDNLYKIRHSLAHLMAKAITDQFPTVNPTIGPPTEHGFYYDFDFGDTEISESDLKSIQKQMRKLLNKWDTFVRLDASPDQARKFFADNQFKTELIEGIIADDGDITLYYSGPTDGAPESMKQLLDDDYELPKSAFIDLCRGGHVENPSSDIDAKSFQLDSIAGAYWRGDANNPQLVRIYGLAYENPDQLAEYLNQRAEAKKRDHRKLGAQLDLFAFSDLVGSGLPLFTPKGTLIRDLVVDKIQSIQSKYGYQRVTSPHITKPDLYKTSGHWDKFGDELFKVKGISSEFVMKPMNCPHHTQIYASQPRSYRDLPIRYMESGVVYRDEQTGELHGLSRVRSITQDDGHVFCTFEQAEEEIAIVVDVIKQFYTSLEMWTEDSFWVSLSVRDPKTPEKYLGEDKNWNRAEKVLTAVAEKQKLPYKRMEGEAAFYGPKLDFMFKDAIGREWQLGTAQLDLVMPSRFELEYMNSKGEKETPVMIHRAVAGSLERFMSIIIEHYAGKFPFWLAPEQMRILTVSDDHIEYATSVRDQLRSAGFRVEIASDESLGKRIRNAKTDLLPYFAVIGEQESTDGTITLESRDGTSETVSVEKALEILGKLLKTKK